MFRLTNVNKFVLLQYVMHFFYIDFVTPRLRQANGISDKHPYHGRRQSTKILLNKHKELHTCGVAEAQSTKLKHP
jgi:hypothetical protein